MSVGEAWLRSKTDPEVVKVKFLLFLLVAWGVLGFKSCREVRYTLSGDTATADIVRLSSGYESGGPYTATFRWRDSATGELRQAAYDARAGELASTTHLDIVYIPGEEGTAIPAKNRSWGWLIAFFGSTFTVLAGLAWWGYALTRPARYRPPTPAADGTSLSYNLYLIACAGVPPHPFCASTPGGGVARSPGDAAAATIPS